MSELKPNAICCRRFRCLSRFIVTCLVSGLLPVEAGGQQLSSEDIDFFERHIRPVLVEHCYECHSASSENLHGGLRLDSAAAMRSGGDSGPLFEPGNTDDSLLLDVLRWESYEMPPSRKLPNSVVKRFEQWIARGAPDPRVESSSEPPGVENDMPGQAFVAEPHWAFQPPQLPAIPSVSHSEWTANEIDLFILAKLEPSNLQPSPPADSGTLLRRLHFVLTGLAPTTDELNSFAATDSVQFDETIDRLLQSPLFGERWARHWLDVARYADTKGYVFQEDRSYPHAYRYRDWVIDAFNRDLPYDQFLIAQIAADQLDDASALPAMGFLTLGRRFINNIHDITDDRIDVVTRGMMGLTVSCARCHDHKYDPIPIDNYYSLYGVFASSFEPNEESAPMAMRDREQPVEPVVFVRGQPHSPGRSVPRQFLACLTDGEPQPFAEGSGRRELASAIASPNNPLTARVWVNRVWLHVFGQPLVATPSDFGLRSAPPSHPELLDWLALKFVESGWSTRWLIRQMVSSKTFQQSSHEHTVGREIDVENRLLWRMNRRRLDLETMRDNLLLAAGRLDTSRGGSSVELTAQPFPTRRTVYGFVERQNLPALFRTFDFASPDTHSPQRPNTTVPQQALFLMNSPFVMEQAVYMAKRGLDETETLSDDGRVRRLFLDSLGRLPADDELSWSRQFLAASENADQSPIVAPTWQYGYGSVDLETNQVHFQPLPHFTGRTWQGGSQLPDGALGWVMLDADGGHPGNDLQHSAIRRWIAPGAGRLSVRGNLNHPSDQGDGVRGWVISDRQGVLGQWDSFHGESATSLARISVEPGEIVDFVVECKQHPNFDSFRWAVKLRLRAEDGALSWDSKADFRGPVPELLDRWQQLAHVLLMTNEFMFVD